MVFLASRLCLADVHMTNKLLGSPYYAFYYYRIGSNSDVGNYNANIVCFEVTTNWG